MLSGKVIRNAVDFPLGTAPLHKKGNWVQPTLPQPFEFPAHQQLETSYMEDSPVPEKVYTEVEKHQEDLASESPRDENGGPSSLPSHHPPDLYSRPHSHPTTEEILDEKKNSPFHEGLSPETKGD